MATVKAFVRKYKNSKDGKQSVRIRIRHKSQSKEFALPSCRVHPDHWDSKDQIVTNDKMLTMRIQNEVMKYKTEINKQLVAGDGIDVEDIYRKANGIETMSNKEEKANASLKAYTFIKDYICDDLILSYGTRKNYKVVYNILKKSYPSLKIADVDGEFLAKLEQKLKKKGLRQQSWTIFE